MGALVQHPLVILGLDGGSFNVLDPLMAAGWLPNLQRLARTGWRTELQSTLPVATLPAWTSFLTAAEPAVHGVVDFFGRVPGSYALRPITGAQRRLPTFLRRLSDAGLRVASLGVPGTFPPEPVDGLTVAGFDAPGAAWARSVAVWPPSFYPELQRLGGWRYATFNEQGRGDARLEAAADALLADIAAKERVALAVLAQQSWDLFFLHLQASDTAAHHLWHTWDRRSPRHCPAQASEALPRVYRRLDRLIGRVLAAAPANARVLVVSDHGMMGAADVGVYLNRWLHQAELLRFAPSAQRPLQRIGGHLGRAVLGRLPRWGIGAAQRLLSGTQQAHLLAMARNQGVDFGASQAFSDELDYAPAIWLNRRGTLPQGRVDAAAAGPLLTRLQAELRDLRHPQTGARLLAQVHRRAELPPGPAAALLPDLLLEPAPQAGYRPSFLLSAGPGPPVAPIAPTQFSAGRGAGLPGVHQRQGILLAAGPGLGPQRLPLVAMAEAGALVYALLGLPVPADLPTQLPAPLQAMLPPTTAATPMPPCPASPLAYDANTSLALAQRLRAMGYID